MNRYRITWKKGYGTTAVPQTVDAGFSFFNEGNAFTQLDRTRIARLEVGQTWEYREMAEHITVERLS